MGGWTIPALNTWVVGFFAVVSVGLLLDIAIAHIYRIIAAGWQR